MTHFYYIDSNGQQKGPVEISTIKLSEIRILPETLVWHENIPNWTQAKNVPELYTIIQQPAYSVPPSFPQTPVTPTPSPNLGSPYAPSGNQRPQSWLWLGICTTLLCCLPFGIVSIVYASKVDSAWNIGNYQGAIDNSNKAKMWGLISAGCGLVANLLFIILAVAA